MLLYKCIRPGNMPPTQINGLPIAPRGGCTRAHVHADTHLCRQEHTHTHTCAYIMDIMVNGLKFTIHCFFTQFLH